MARVGYLGPAPAASFAPRVEALRAGLRDLGYVEGRNLSLQFRWAERAHDMPGLAAELVRAGVDVIFAQSSTETAAVLAITKTIPVVFAAHAASCMRGELPDPPGIPDRAIGKAIVFARDPCVSGDTDAWLADTDIRDVPHAGDAIAAGSPVCTVFAEAADAASCEAALVERAQRIYEDMRRWGSTIHES